MKVLATYSIKGGVGKTTAIDLAHEAAAAGARVLLWDLDPQGAATFFVRVKASVKGGAERLVSRAGSLDANIFCSTAPPGSRSPARACSTPPTRSSCRRSPPPCPNAPSSNSPAFLAEQTHAPTLLPFASMLDRRKRLQRGLVAHLTRDIPGFLQTAIPNASVIERVGVEREPVARFAPTSPAATAFRDLWAEIAARVWT